MYYNNEFLKQYKCNLVEIVFIENNFVMFPGGMDSNDSFSSSLNMVIEPGQVSRTFLDTFICYFFKFW